MTDQWKQIVLSQARPNVYINQINKSYQKHAEMMHFLLKYFDMNIKEANKNVFLLLSSQSQI